MNINSVTVLGRLTRDPELKALPSGIKVAGLAVATSRSYKDKQGERKETVEFHNIVVFGNTAEACGKHLIKGQIVAVQGRLQTRKWEVEGKNHYRTEIIAESIQFGPKPLNASKSPQNEEVAIDADTREKINATGQASGKTTPKAGGPDSIEYPTEEINPDDIPF